MSTLKFIMILIIITVALLFSGHVILEHSAPKMVMQVLVHYHWIVIIWRYLIYLIVIMLWPWFIQTVGKSKSWSTEMMVYFSAQRLKIALFFAIIEIFFVYNLVGHVLVWI